MRSGDYPFHKDSTLVPVSHARVTAGTLAAVPHAARAGAPALASTNVKGSAMWRDAAETIYMRAGLEIGVAATKTFTSQILCGILWAIQMGRARKTLSPERAKSLLKGAKRVPAAIQDVLD